MLCYTAIPDDEVTQLCIHIANHLAAAESENNLLRMAIKYLMPGLCLESMYGPPYDKNLGDPSNPTAVSLDQLIRSHVMDEWGDALIPVGLLVCTPQEDAHGKKIWPRIYYAEGSPAYQNPGLTPEELNRLVKHSSLTRQVYDTWEASEKAEYDEGHFYGRLQKLYRDLRDNSTFGIGAEEDAAMKVYAALTSFTDYYEQLSTPIQNQIPEAVSKEIHLLLNLASGYVGETDAKILYATFNTNDQEKTLYISNDLITMGQISEAQISVLTPQAKYTSKAKAYLSEIRFERKKETLKTITLQMIKGILESADDPSRPALELAVIAVNYLKKMTMNHRGNMATCLNTRGSALASAMAPHQETLQGISPDAERLDQIKKDRRSQLENAKTRLKVVLSQLREISTKRLGWGYDSLGLTTDLLEQLKIPFQCNNLNEYRQTISMLSPQEITRLMSMKIVDDLILKIKTPENFIFFITELSLDRLEMVLQLLVRSPQLIKSLIISPKILASFLSILRVEQMTILLEVLKEKLPELIRVATVLIEMLQLIEREKHAIIWRAMRKVLPKLIQSQDDFNRVLRYCSREQGTIFITEMEEIFTEWVKSLRDFRFLMETLVPEQCMIVYEMLKKMLAGAIKSTQDFFDVLGFIPQEKHDDFCRIMQGELLKLIQSLDHFNKVLHFPKVLRYIPKEILPGLIKNTTDLAAILEIIPHEQLKFILLAKTEFIAKIMGSVKHFVEFLKALSDEQKTIICQVMKKELLALIQSAKHFRSVLQYLNPKQRDDIFEAIKEALPKLIQSSWDLGMVLRFLRSEQYNVVFDILKNTLPELINNVQSIQDVLGRLEPAQHVSFYRAMKRISPEAFLKISLDPELSSLSCAEILDLFQTIPKQESGLAHLDTPVNPKGNLFRLFDQSREYTDNAPYQKSIQCLKRAYCISKQRQPIDPLRKGEENELFSNDSGNHASLSLGGAT